MAEKKKKTDLYDEQDPKELEAIANEILSEGADALDTEPFTLIELPPEGSGRKKPKKSISPAAGSMRCTWIMSTTCSRVMEKRPARPGRATTQ